MCKASHAGWNYFSLHVPLRDSTTCPLMKTSSLFCPEHPGPRCTTPSTCFFSFSPLMIQIGCQTPRAHQPPCLHFPCQLLWYSVMLQSNYNAFFLSFFCLTAVASSVSHSQVLQVYLYVKVMSYFNQGALQGRQVRRRYVSSAFCRFNVIYLHNAPWL